MRQDLAGAELNAPKQPDGGTSGAAHGGEAEIMDTGRHERIQRRAYEFWEQEGRPEGRAHDHWYRAEAEVADVHPGTPGTGGDENQSTEQAPSDLAADEASKGGGGVGP